MSTQASDLDGEGIFNFFMPYTLDCDIPEGFPTSNGLMKFPDLMILTKTDIQNHSGTTGIPTGIMFAAMNSAK